MPRDDFFRFLDLYVMDLDQCCRQEENELPYVRVFLAVAFLTVKCYMKTVR